MTTKTITTPTLAKLLGCSNRTVYLAGHSGDGIGLSGERVRPIIVGRRMAWPAAPIYEALGIAVPEDTGAVA